MMNKKSKRMLIVKKIGMTSYISENGEVVAATVLKQVESSVINHKFKKDLGYDATVIGYDPSKKINSPKMGLFKKHNKDSYRHTIELRDEHLERIVMDDFKEHQEVEIRSKTKGKGFSGTIKRHNFKRGPMTHGSKSHRIPGSIGQCATPSRVMKGKKMPGQYGCVNKKQKSKLLVVDNERSIILIKGSCPGPNGSYVYVYGNCETAA